MPDPSDCRGAHDTAANLTIGHLSDDASAIVTPKIANLEFAGHKLGDALYVDKISRIAEIVVDVNEKPIAETRAISIAVDPKHAVVHLFDVRAHAAVTLGRPVSRQAAVPSRNAS